MSASSKRSREGDEATKANKTARLTTTASQPPEEGRSSSSSKGGQRQQYAPNVLSENRDTVEWIRRLLTAEGSRLPGRLSRIQERNDIIPWILNSSGLTDDEAQDLAKAVTERTMKAFTKKK